MNWKEKLNTGLSSVKGQVSHYIHEETERRKERDNLYKSEFRKQELKEIRRKAHNDAIAKYSKKKKVDHVGFGGLSFDPNASLLYGSSKRR